MAERKVRAVHLTGYDANRRALLEAFALPEDLREWVTVRLDPAHDDAAQRARVSVCARAGTTTAALDVDLEEGGQLARLLARLLEEHRDALHHQLKLDLATNLMAASLAPEGPPDDR